jgi:ribosome-associated protein
MALIRITPRVALPDSEISWEAVRAQGAGGQNVNKVSSAIHLRFDIKASSLPETWKVRLCERRDHRISREGVLVIKAQRHRSQEQNREDALARLVALLQSAGVVPKVRKATRPTRGAQERRLAGKARHAGLKRLRGERLDTSD